LSGAYVASKDSGQQMLQMDVHCLWWGWCLWWRIRNIKGSQFWFRWKIQSENWYFSANQISAFLQQLTPPFQRFFRQKIQSRVMSIDIFSCPWRGHGEGCVTCHFFFKLRLVQLGVRFEKWADVVLSASILSFIISYVGGAPEERPKKIAKEQIFIAC
jgi:hypothetical protein